MRLRKQPSRRRASRRRGIGLDLLSSPLKKVSGTFGTFKNTRVPRVPDTFFNGLLAHQPRSPLRENASMATHQPGVWGIDIGQCAVKAIRLESINGEVTATAFDYIEHPKILSQPDADPDELTREALQQFLSNNDLKGDLVAISVPGQSGLARFVKLPPVDEKKIPDIVRFEAKQQIPFPLEEVVWGFQRLGAGTTSDNMVLDAEIGLFAMKRDMVN